MAAGACFELQEGRIAFKVKPSVEDHSDRNYWLVLGAFSAAIFAFVLASREPAAESRPIKAWLRDLGASEPYRRNRAEAVVRRMGAGILPVLLSQVESTRTNDQAQAVLGFAALGDRARPALPRLTELVRNPPTALTAARALAAIGPAGVPVLTNTLAGPIRSIRIACARALGRMRTDGRMAVPALIGVLGEADDDLRHFATRALGNLAADPVQVVPALINRLQDPSVEIRKVAAQSLGKFKTRARVAVPALVKALDDPDLGVKLAAAAALKEINPTLGQAGIK